MKKIVLSVLSALFVLMGSIQPNFALNASEGFQASVNYWSQKETLESADEVMTYASLGLDVSKKTLGDYIVSDEYASSIAKTVIALVLHGDDPRNYNGKNYVEMLENCVHENGAFDKTNDSTFANYQVYGVYALYVIQSKKLDIAADYLISLADANGAFGSSYGPSSDITGWVIEALSLVNKTKYETTIQNAIHYVQSKMNDNAGYDDYGYGANANTQACVLMGLATYDAAGLKNGTYNKNGINPLDVLLGFENDNGSFWYKEAGEDNVYATLQGAQMVGYSELGSVYQTASLKYKEILEKKEEKPVVKEEKPVVKEEKKNYVQTSDSTSIFTFVMMMLVSGILLLKGKKVNG